jgi:hypothetical protein
MNKPLNTILAFIIAVLVAGLLGTIFQTQLNLAAIREIGPLISFDMRMANTWHDLVNFAPLYLAIIAATFLIAFIVAELIVWMIPGHRLFWLTLSAVVGLWVTFKLIDYFAPMPTFIAATRRLGGTLIMLLAAAIGAVAYSLLTDQLNRRMINKEEVE